MVEENTDLTLEERIENMRKMRDELLKQTDIYALSDRVMPEDVRIFRQQLRDLPNKEGFPDCDFPSQSQIYNELNSGS